MSGVIVPLNCLIRVYLVSSGMSCFWSGGGGGGKRGGEGGGG